MCMQVPKVSRSQYFGNRQVHHLMHQIAHRFTRRRLRVVNMGRVIIVRGIRVLPNHRQGYPITRTTTSRFLTYHLMSSVRVIGFFTSRPLNLQHAILCCGRFGVLVYLPTRTSRHFTGRQQASTNTSGSKCLQSIRTTHILVGCTIATSLVVPSSGFFRPRLHLGKGVLLFPTPSTRGTARIFSMHASRHPSYTLGQLLLFRRRTYGVHVPPSSITP